MFLWLLTLESPSVGRITLPCSTMNNSLARVAELLEADPTFRNSTLVRVESAGSTCEGEGLGLFVSTLS